MKKLDPERERWNKQVEEEYQKHKMEEKIKKDREMANRDPKRELVGQYKQLQKDFIKIDDNETIKKWKILSKAYKIGKEIYGQDFSVLKLSQHFDIPYTTTKRVLSLDKTNERTWSLIKKGKISAFKVAQICMTKNIKYQDQIIDFVIAEDLSTVQIKRLRITENGLNVKEARLENAIKNGFTRKSTAYKSLRDTSKRMMKLLDIDKNNLPESKISDIIEILDELQSKLNKKIQELVSTNG
jgi:hypothetical protein